MNVPVTAVVVELRSYLLSLLKPPRFLTAFSITNRSLGAFYHHRK